MRGVARVGLTTRALLFPQSGICQAVTACPTASPRTETTAARRSPVTATTTRPPDLPCPKAHQTPGTFGVQNSSPAGRSKAPSPSGQRPTRLSQRANARPRTLPRPTRDAPEGEGSARRAAPFRRGIVAALLHRGDHRRVRGLKPRHIDPFGVPPFDKRRAPARAAPLVERNDQRFGHPLVRYGHRETGPPAPASGIGRHPNPTASSNVASRSPPGRMHGPRAQRLRARHPSGRLLRTGAAAGRHDGPHRGASSVGVFDGIIAKEDSLCPLLALDLIGERRYIT